jgi:prepilin-type N-terminal cleavage/methylation domain-containing protein
MGTDRKASAYCDEHGFTLVELLIVISILGVLLTVVLPNIGGIMGPAKQDSFNADLHNIQNAATAYYLLRSPNLFPTASGGAGTIDFTWLVTTSSLLKSVPRSSTTVGGSYTWGMNVQGVITTTFVPNIYP